MFSAGAFSSQVGAMNERLVGETTMTLHSENIPKDKQEAPVGVEFNICNQVYKFDNIPSNLISSDFFDKYIKDDLNKVEGDEAKKEIVDEAVRVLNILNTLAAEPTKITYFDPDFFKDGVKIYDENDAFRVVTLSHLYETGYLNEPIEEFWKPIDILYFATKDYLKSNNGEDYDTLDLYTHLTEYVSYSEVLSKYFKTLYNKIKSAAEKYFETSYNEIKSAAGESFEDIEELKKGLAHSDYVEWDLRENLSEESSDAMKKRERIFSYICVRCCVTFCFLYGFI